MGAGLFVTRGVLLGHVGGGVDAEAVDADGEPGRHDLEHFVLDRRLGVVQVGLMGIEPMEHVADAPDYARRWLGSPTRTTATIATTTDTSRSGLRDMCPHLIRIAERLAKVDVAAARASLLATTGSASAGLALYTLLDARK